MASGLAVVLVLTWVLAAATSYDERSVPGADQGFQLLPPYLYEHHVLCTEENGRLMVQFYTEGYGEDAIGSFNTYGTGYITASGDEVEFTTRQYYDVGINLYTQIFYTGIEATSVGNKDAVSTGFPVFRLPSSSENPMLRFVTPGDHMTGWTLYSQGYFWEDKHKFRSGETGGVVGFLVDGGDNGTWSLMTSALTQPMAVNNWLDVTEEGVATLHWGLQGLAEEIPPGFTITVITATDNTTFNNNVMKWGGTIQTLHKVQKLPDASLDYIGYWTDNGAYHYYNPSPFDNYEDVLVDLYSRTQERGMYFGYVQLDSWWYFKGVGGGVKNWTAQPVVFPNGIEAVGNQTGWPFAAHNRYFASDTDYAQQNGGPFPFVIDEESHKALPLDQSFWDHLFDESLPWGLTLYEQDWLDRTYEEISALHSNVSLATSWLEDMDRAATSRGLPVQFCMALPRHTLHAASLDSVTQIRVSEDYLITPNQWSIGHTSLFAHALGLKPFKDVFWTSPYNSNNPYAWCEALEWVSNTTGKVTSSYSGRQNVTASGIPCLAWDVVDYHGRYPHDSLYDNYCRNPGQSKDKAYCFTTASLDTPEDSWEWEYCDIPVCDVDCFVQFGYNYVGNQSVTESGRNCTDWNGEYGLEGKVCRNPTGETRPWCYVDDQHSEADNCNNQCPEAEEYNPRLQSAVATLSTGPVAVGDKQENIDKNLVLKSCRSDGLLLQPQKPLTAIDSYFLLDSRPNIWTADVTIDEFTFGIIFQAETEETFTLSPRELNLELAYSTETITWQITPTTETVEVTERTSDVSLNECGGFLNFCLTYTSPLLSVNGDKLAVLGEVSKWTPVAQKRIDSIKVDNGSLLVDVIGAPEERVLMTFYSHTKGLFIINCEYGSLGGLKTIDVASKTCS